MAIEFKSAVIFVNDMTKSRAFYEELLLQEVEMDFGLNVGYKSGFALWQVDHAYQMIFQTTTWDDKQLGHQNFELYFEITDLDSISKKLSDAGVTFVHPVHEQPWGQRAIRICDPDGHIVEIAEPMPVVILRMRDKGMSVESIAQRTGMPFGIVDLIVKANDNN
jgi:catechol 2,3-dioxygenase-like lactoylglutathione lyase family enzyme